MKTLKIVVYCTWLASLLPCVCLAQQKVVLAKDFFLSLPPDFQAMDAEALDRNYLQKTPPLAAYAHHMDERAQWVFSSKESSILTQDLSIARDFLRAGIEHLYQGRVHWIEDKEIVLNGQAALSLIFISTLENDTPSAFKKTNTYTRKYHMLARLTHEGEEFTLHFSCPLSKQRAYEKEALDVLYSLQSR